VIGMNHDGGDHRAAHGSSICCLYSRMAERAMMMERESGRSCTLDTTGYQL
jgi:hypothetical protein